MKWLCESISKLFLALHTGAHIYNFEALIASWEDMDPLVIQLNNYSDTGALTRLNPIREKGLVRKVSTVIMTHCYFFAVVKQSIQVFQVAGAYKVFGSKPSLRQQKMGSGVSQ